MLNHILQTTEKYREQMPKEIRKTHGQFFTGRETAIFMAGLFKIPSEFSELSVLDPGAGSGILSAALVERLQDTSMLRKIHLTCYETDSHIIELLRENLNWMCTHSRVPLNYRLIPENYILSQMPQTSENPTACLPAFDFIIGNPPYRKIAGNAPEASAMPEICYGTPNLYALFAAMSLRNLREGGQLVYIIPRSWTSGAYFRQFRKYFLCGASLEHIHLFASRNRVFEQEDVLQETMIIKAKKSARPASLVTITTTENGRDFSRKTSFQAPYHAVVSGENRYVYLPRGEEDLRTLKCLRRWTDTLPELGMKMHTGLTVDFRYPEILRDNADSGGVPLFYARHIRHGKVVFPSGNGHEYITTQKGGLLQPNTNYLFVKRFTPKEEPRRLQCGVYLAKQYPRYVNISTQNKINFIGATVGELSEHTVYGLYVLFNSTFYDRCYRILNGSTQVNATEINSMPVPPLAVIEQMGRILMQSTDISSFHCDRILENYL